MKRTLLALVVCLSAVVVGAAGPAYADAGGGGHCSTVGSTLTCSGGSGGSGGGAGGHVSYDVNTFAGTYVGGAGSGGGGTGGGGGFNCTIYADGSQACVGGHSPF